MTSFGDSLTETSQTTTEPGAVVVEDTTTTATYTEAVADTTPPDAMTDVVEENVANPASIAPAQARAQQIADFKTANPTEVLVVQADPNVGGDRF